MKCTAKAIRCGDEYQCRCGITWGINEDKPRCRDITEKPRARKPKGSVYIRNLRDKYGWVGQ